jgi:hypothetical protein
MATEFLPDIQVQAGRAVWTPSSSVTDHLGGHLDPECDFFVVPPREIGDVVHAYTSLKRQIEPRAPEARLALVAIWAALAGGAGYGLDHLTGIHSPLWYVVPAAVAALIAWAVTPFSHFCNFVGKDGCAQFKCKGTREGLKQKRIFCFKDAWAVSTSSTRHFTNGVYTGTTFNFSWYPPEGKKTVYQISGRHTANLKVPPLKNLYNFARATETAWIKFLIPKLDDQLKHQGYINFYMGDGRWARLGPGFIDIVDKKGEVHHCAASDIGSAKIASGQFTISRKDAKSTFFGLLGSSGTFRFNYGIMYNARLFLIAFENFLNVKVQ